MLAEYLTSRIGYPVDKDFIDGLSAILMGETQPKPLDALPVLRVGEFTVEAVRLADTLDEMRELHTLHWKETEAELFGDNMNPDYEAYLKMERDGSMLFFGLFHGGSLVGDCAIRFHRSLHTQETEAEECALFIRREYRGRGLAGKFVGYVEEYLKKLGVVGLTVTAKSVNRADKFFEHAGFKLAAKQYYKQLR